jgi:hypothetical protein
LEYELTRLERVSCPYLILRGNIRSKDLEMLVSLLSKDVIDQDENCILIETIEAKADLSELEIVNFLRNFPPSLRAL